MHVDALTGVGLAHHGTDDAVAGAGLGDAQQVLDTGAGDHGGPVGGGGPGQGHGVPGVVDLGIVEAHRTLGGLDPQPGGQAVDGGARQGARPGHRAAVGPDPREQVVEGHAGAHVGALHPAGDRQQEGHRADQVGGQAVQEQPALGERLVHQGELPMLEVAQPPVGQPRGPARGSGREVAGLDQPDGQPTGGGVERGPAADHAAADHQHVQGVLGAAVAQALQVGRATLRAEGVSGLPVQRISGGHGPIVPMPSAFS